MSAGSGERATRAAEKIVGGALVVLAVGMALAAVVVGIVAQVDWSPTTRLLITAAVYAPVAAVILPYRRPLLFSIVASLSLMSGALALVIVVSAAIPADGDDGGGLVAFVAMLARQPEIAAIAILPWLLVRSQSARRVGIGVGVAAILVDLVAWTAWAAGLAVPWWLGRGAIVIAVSSLVAATLVLVGQWRRGDARERGILTWFAAGAALLVLSYSRLVVALPPLPAAFADAMFLVAQALLPTALLALVLDSEVRGRRDPLFTAVVSAQSLAVAAALYLLVDAVAVGLGVPAAPAGAVAAGALALAFAGVHGFVVDRTSRLYFGPSADARSVLRRLGERLAPEHPAESGLVGLAQSLQATWGLSSVGFVLAGESESVTAGVPGPARLSVDLVARGTRIGTVEVTGDDDADLAHAVAPVLDEVAPLIAIAVLLATVNQAVEMLRIRTLGVRLEERRMLHRELHDELVPSLAGLGFAMAGAERLVVAGDHVAAERALTAIRSEVADRAEDVRILARTLMPAALDSGDLEGALRELARRFTGEDGGVEVRATGVDVLDARLQIAVYVIAAEAVTHLRRAGRRRIGLAVGLTDAATTIRIHDSAGGSAGLRGEISDAVGRRAADVGGAVALGEDDEGVFWEAVIPR